MPNWWMGMATRERGANHFGLNAMLSLDPATVGRTFGNTSLIIAGGPVGEPTLGPVAFMHRASAAGLPLAPLGHHTFDSTHISFGVVTALIERGRWTVEGSAFNGREPDEHRWDFDFGAMDSVAGRVWFRPTQEWAVQISTGLLREPEELEPGNARRTTTSASWLRKDDRGFRAITAGYGANTAHGEHRHGVFGEFTVERDANSMFGRAEFQQVETGLLFTGGAPASHDFDDPRTVTAVTVGAARRRLPTDNMGRMWNMRMSEGPNMGMKHWGDRKS